MESELQYVSEQHKVDLNGLSIEWMGLKGGFQLHFKYMRFLDAQGGELVGFNNLSATLDFSYLLLEQKLYFEQVTLDTINIEVLGSIARMKDSSAAEADLQVLFEPMFQGYQNNKILPFKRLHIKRIVKPTDNALSDIILFNDVRMQFTQTGSYILLDVTANDSGLDHKLRADVIINQSGELNASVGLHNVAIDALSIFYPAASDLPSFHNVSLSGAVRLDLLPNLALSHITLSLYNHAFPEKEYIDLYYEKSSRNISRPASLKAEFALSRLAFDEVLLLWPKALIPKTRAWIKSHIQRAELSNITGNINIAHAADGPVKVEKEAVQIAYDYTNLSIMPLKDRSPITDASGRMLFSGEDFTILVNQARIDSSELNNGRITISPYRDKARLFVKVNLDGKLKHFLPFAIHDSSKIPFIGIEGAKGNVDGNLQFALNLSRKQGREFHFDSDLSITGFSAPASVMSRKLVTGNIEVRGESERIIIEPTLVDADQQVRFTLSIPVLSDAPQDIKVQTNQLESLLGYLDLPIIAEGRISATIERDGEGQFALSGDGTKLFMRHEMLGWQKAAGMPLTFQASITKSGSQVRLHDITVNSEAFSLQAPELTFSDNQVQLISIKRYSSPLSDFSLLVKQHGSKYETVLTGAKLNSGLLTLLVNHFVSKTVSSENNKFGVVVSAQLHEFFLSGKRSLYNVQANILCTYASCAEIRVSAIESEQTPFKITYSSEDNGKIELVSSNIGSLLRALNFSKNLRGGAIELSLTRRGDNIYRGGVIMKDFVVQDLPILTRILNLASLTGFLELLSSGVSFNSLKSNLTYHNKVVTLDDLKASGASMGITTQGDIDLKARQLELSGAVIPSYMINSLLGRIPLLGQLLVGKKGEGVIATRYTVTGDIEDPEISVNPLSMLTPGFLRNIWGEGVQ